MGEVIDPHLILVDGPQEAARARMALQQDRNQIQAARRRERALKSPEGPARAVRAAWFPLTRADTETALRADPKLTVYEGSGPPTEDPPAGLVGSTYYMDDQTGVLYRWEA